VNTSSNAFPDRRRRRTHSTEFKAKVVAGCRKPGVSIAAVALDYRLNANLVRRWVVADERTPSAKPIETAMASPAPITVENRAFIPIQMERSAVTPPQEISIELRRGATIVKVGWPLLAAADCAAWLRELLR
jgi:transposase-like protein